jgi:Family of unknown function (DUF6502)
VQKKTPAHDSNRAATVAALRQIADELLETVFDAGLTVQQLNYIIRERAIYVAGKRVLRDKGHVSKSRVAIITGLPRSEVARIAKSPHRYEKAKLGQNPARKLLAGWFSDPRFLTPDGEPVPLAIFGRKRTFEALVSTYGSGIPVRAMLDELLQLGAVETLEERRVRVRSRIPISIGRTPEAIAALGDRCSDLIRTLSTNMHRPAPPMFEATSLVVDADPKLVPMIRRAIDRQGASFIRSANSLLARSRSIDSGHRPRSAAKRRLGVTVYYFESEGDSDSEISAKPISRTNLRRRSSTS